MKTVVKSLLMILLLGGLLSSANPLRANNDKKSHTPGAQKTAPVSPLKSPCTGVQPWSSATVYTGTQFVVYNGHLWKAKWWTQANIPGASSDPRVDPWEDLGPC